LTLKNLTFNAIPALKCFSLKPQTTGEIPAARINFKMLTIDRSHVAVYGGLGSEVYNDFKVLDAS